MSDVIRLKDLTIFGFYGVSPAEREVGQKIQMDLDIHVDLSAACESDRLQDTINYESIHSRVMEVASPDRRFCLLEALGEQICEAILSSFDIERVDIRLRKLNLPFPNNLAYVEVHLTRENPVL